MANGFFQGGFASGAAQAEREALAGRQLDLQQQQMEADERLDLQARADSAIGETMKVIGGTIKAGLEAGRSPEQIRGAVAPLLADAQALAGGAGRDPNQLGAMVEAQLAGPTAAEVAQGKARAEVAGAQAGAEALGGTPEEIRQNTLALAGISPANQGEFMRLLGALRQVNPGTAEHTAIANRINKLSTPEAGQTFSVDTETGAVTFTSGGQQQIPGRQQITGAQLDKLRGAKQGVDAALRLTQKLQTELQRNPGSFGLLGTARRAGARIGGIASDIATLDPTGTAQSVDEAVNNFLDQVGATDEQARGVGELSTDEKVLLFGMARALQGGGGRLLATSIDQAKAISGLTGFTSSAEIAGRLNAMEERLTEASIDFGTRMQQGVAADGAQEQRNLNFPTRDDFDRAMIQGQIRVGDRVTIGGRQFDVEQ